MKSRLPRSCRAFRSASSTAGAGTADHSAHPHLDDCAACAAWQRRWMAARDELSRPLSSTVPDSGFAQRVRAQLPSSAIEPIGETSRRWIPLAAAVLLALAWANWTTTTTPESVADPLDDLLLWSLETAEGAR